MDDLPESLRSLPARLSAGGLDLARFFSSARYDDAIASTDLPSITGFGRSDALALVVGNGRALHAAIAALPPDDPIVRSENPIDDHAARVLGLALDRIEIPHAIHFGRERPRARVSLLHAAFASGLASRAPNGMAVHPELGLWFGLRAVVVFDLPAAIRSDAAAASPCAGCAAPCVAAGERARATLGPNARASIAEHADLWIAARDACPEGRAHRYDEPWLRYHTTKERRFFDEGRQGSRGCPAGSPVPSGARQAAPEPRLK